MTTNCENPQLRNAQLNDKALTFAPAPILIFPVRGRSRVRSHITVCIRVILKHYPFTLEGGLLELYPPEQNTENKLQVYVLLLESVRECARSQGCALVHSNKNGLTGETTFDFATGVYYNVVFKSLK